MVAGFERRFCLERNERRRFAIHLWLERRQATCGELEAEWSDGEHGSAVGGSESEQFGNDRHGRSTVLEWEAWNESGDRRSGRFTGKPDCFEQEEESRSSRFD